MIQCTKAFSKVTIEAKIFRADGSIEDLGIISQTKDTFIKKLKRRVKIWLK